ncbi:MAG: hypothetical protein AB7S36_23895, partial [Planctomycetota bacterium]
MPTAIHPATTPGGPPGTAACRAATGRAPRTGTRRATRPCADRSGSPLWAAPGLLYPRSTMRRLIVSFLMFLLRWMLWVRYRIRVEGME